LVCSARWPSAARAWPASAWPSPESLAAGYLDPLLGGGFSNIASYLVLLAALFVRPYGLFGRPDVRRV